MKKNDDSIKCFGTFQNEGSCLSCMYAESCQWATEHPLRDNGLGLISLSSGIEGRYWEQLCMPPSSEEKEEIYDISHVEELLAALDKLDKYTLKILARIIMFSDTSIASLIEWRKCSRQAMHEKMLYTARRFPFVAGVFELTIRRMPLQNTKLHQIKRRETINA